MSTLASLAGMLGDTQIRPWSEGMQSVNQAQLGQQAAQTGLIKLAQLKQSQASEAEVMAAIQRDPSLQALLFGGGMPQSTLGSLGTAPAVPPGGALTQQAFAPGQPPGVPQVVPGGQDLSRFAGVSPQGGGPIPPNVMAQAMPTVTPPQSVLGSLGPAGGMPGPQQGQMQGPQNALLEMARRDPRAALMLQGQMQAQQDRQWKMQEQQLGMGVKVAEFVARELQGVTDQASLDHARERIRQVHPQAAAQVPQMYSKEAVESVQQRGIAVAQRATDALASAKARHEDVKTQFLPKLFEDAGTAPTAQAPAAGGTTGTTGRAPQESDTTRAIRAEVLRQGGDQALADLAVAVATQESYLNPNAVGDGGKSVGLFQLQRGAATDAKIDPDRGQDQALNIQGGVTYLKQKLAQTKGNVDEALKLYNGGGDPNYVANVRRFLPGSTTGTAQAPATDPRIAQLETQIAAEERKAQQYGAMGYESNATQANNKAQRLTAERTRLLEEARRQQERGEEIPQAVKKEEALGRTKQELERQRQAGPMLPEDRRKLLTGLRSDIRAEPTFKVYQDVRNGYQNVRIGAESDSAQGDLAIINGMAKILDPSSAVMTGEAKNVEEAQGQLAVWFNSPQRFFEGDRLTKENRQRFLKMAHALAKEKLTTAQTELKTVYGSLAKEGNIDFEQVVPLPDLKPIGSDKPAAAMSDAELLAERNRLRGN